MSNWTVGHLTSAVRSDMGSAVGFYLRYALGLDPKSDLGLGEMIIRPKRQGEVF